MTLAAMLQSWGLCVVLSAPQDRPIHCRSGHGRRSHNSILDETSLEVLTALKQRSIITKERSVPDEVPKPGLLRIGFSPAESIVRNYRSGTPVCAGRQHRPCGGTETADPKHLDEEKLWSDSGG